MSDYLVPAGRAEAEHVDKKSRFIGQVCPVTSEAEAMAFVESIRKKHADATHNVWAYVLHSGAMRWSDDGEPGGTSGQPTLNVFRSSNVSEVCCVVTRYFGGILLGSGGLVRAYSKAASLALEAAGLARMAPWTEVLISCGYSQYERVRRMLSEYGAEDIDAAFGADVDITAMLPIDQVEPVIDRLTDLTAGTARSIVADTTYRPQKI